MTVMNGQHHRQLQGKAKNSLPHTQQRNALFSIPTKVSLFQPKNRRRNSCTAKCCRELPKFACSSRSNTTCHHLACRWCLATDMRLDSAIPHKMDCEDTGGGELSPGEHC